MDVYKLRNIVVSLQGGKHCFAKTRGCLSEDALALVGRQEDVWLLTGRCLLEGRSGAW